MRLPSILRNPVTAIGAGLAFLAGEAILVLVVIDVTRAQPNPYIGIFTYLILPVFFILGLVLIPLGALRERRRRRRLPEGKALPPHLRLDLNDPRQRSFFLGAIGSAFLFLLLFSGLGSRAYHFTDSTVFCGQSCHEVMKPEYTAYRNSPHARVGCVDCHVGPGASWWVKSKFSGVHQVYAVTFNTYPRPIPGPIESLRPAQETCEQCHWPERFFGAQLRVFTHYAEDETNTPRQYQLLLKTGGGSPTVGPSTGIHWHMNIAHEVKYIARDSLRQDIPWVEVRDPDGAVRVYQSTTHPLSPEDVTNRAPRRMDCMDCHNRPTHIFPSPSESVDQSLFLGHLDASLPFIKAQAVSALTREYPDQETGVGAIATQLKEYYRENYPELFRERRAPIDGAISEVQRIYRTTTFPKMGVNWRTYPDNIGHMQFPGCFRCHDGQHATQSGLVLTRSCEVCHLILAQGEGTAMTLAPQEPLRGGEPFRHPVELGTDLTEVNCTDCHGAP